MYYADTMTKKASVFKRLAYDTLGVLLIIISPLLGWLPGPGGIPIFLAGLRLLAIHHPSADRLQKKIVKEGYAFFKKLFTKHPVVQAIYDFFSAVLIFGGFYLINTYTRNMTLTFAIVSIGIGLALFLGNRDRLETLVKKARKNSR
jgi:hypothetical protein